MSTASTRLQVTSGNGLQIGTDLIIMQRLITPKGFKILRDQKIVMIHLNQPYQKKFKEAALFCAMTLTVQVIVSHSV